MMNSEATFFPTPDDFEKWLENNHDKVQELWVGYYKKGTGKPSMTWPESVKEALCFGWIDGLRKSIDEESYKIRFTPRRLRSNWSNTNIRYVKELRKAGKMRPAGLKAYRQKDKGKSGIYSFEQQKPSHLDPAFLKILESNKTAWKNFQTMPPSYQKMVSFWIMSAKREETRKRRFDILLDCSFNNVRVPPFRRPGE